MTDLLACLLALLKPSTWRNPYPGYVPRDPASYGLTAGEAPIDLPHDHVWED